MSKIEPFDPDTETAGGASLRNRARYLAAFAAAAPTMALSLFLGTGTANAEGYAECLTRHGYPARILSDAQIDACWKAGQAEISSKAAATTTATTTTTTPATSSSTTTSGFHLPDLNIWHFVAAGIIAIAIITIASNSGSKPTGHGRGTIPDGKARADRRGERAVGVFFLGVGVIALGGASYGFSGIILGALAGAPFIAGGAVMYSRSQEASTGFDLAAKEHRAQIDEARRAHNAAPGEFDDLGLNLPRAAFDTSQFQQPRITVEQARAKAQHQAVTNGFSAPAGSATAALLDIAGNIGPTIAGLDSVARDLKWGAWTTDGEERTWQPYATVSGVDYYEDGDASVLLDLHHASLDENTIGRALPSLLRAWKCRSGEVAREVDGRIRINITNRTAKQQAAEERAATGADEVWDF